MQLITFLSCFYQNECILGSSINWQKQVRHLFLMSSFVRGHIMSKTTRTVAAITAAIAMMASQTSVATAQSANTNASPSPSTLSLNVNSNIKKAPDMATISAGVVTQSRTAKAAMEDNARRMTTAFAALKSAGIADRDMQTSGVNLSPQYTYVANQRPTIKGYEATNRVSVRIRSLENIGPVLDALVAQGVNEINGPTFGIDNPEAELDTARTQAMATAMRRAELYARAAGMRVKRVLTINESGGYEPQQPRPLMMMSRSMSADAAPETPVAPGEVTLSIQLNIQFELEK
jgi:uncharacterized protein YggE